MESQREIGLSESLPDIVVAHRPRAKHALLGRLHDEHQRALPFILARNHLPRCSDEARDVHVVSASVHYEHRITGDRILLPRTRGVLQTRLLFDRKTVHVSAHHDERAVTVLQYGNNSRAANAFGDLESSQAKLHRHTPGSFRFNCRQLRVAVEVIEQPGEIFVVIFPDGVANFARKSRNGEESCDQADKAIMH